jgi:hypothetical protein
MAAVWIVVRRGDGMSVQWDRDDDQGDKDWRRARQLLDEAVAEVRQMLVTTDFANGVPNPGDDR